jgi:aspergillopepsin I
MFTASGYQVGATGTKGPAVSGIADTGTTLLLLPTTVVKAYYGKVTGAKYDSYQGGYTLPCSGTIPDFILYIGTTKINIPGSFIAFAPVTTSGQTCFGGLQANTGIGLSIFGDIALKAAYVVFENSGTPRLGWANKPL